MFELCGQTSRGVSLTRAWRWSWYCFILCKALSSEPGISHYYWRWLCMQPHAIGDIDNRSPKIANVHTDDTKQTAQEQSSRTYWPKVYHLHENTKKCNSMLLRLTMWFKNVFMFKEIRYRFKWLYHELKKREHNGSWHGPEPFRAEAIWNAEECASSHWNISKYSMNEPASRKSQSPVEIAANLSMKQKPKQRATAGQATRARRPNASDTFGWYQTTGRARSLGATAKAEQL